MGSDLEREVAACHPGLISQGDWGDVPGPLQPYSQIDHEIS